jgi:hypothetical protein
MANQDAIPLEKIVSHTPSTTGARRMSAPPVDTLQIEKTHGGLGKGLRRKGAGGLATSEEDPDGTLTRMGRIYTKIVNFSVVTRYFIYVLPLALLLAIPIIVGATAGRTAELGGVRIVWLFTWIEIGEWKTNLFTQWRGVCLQTAPYWVWYRSEILAINLSEHLTYQV